LEGRLLHICLRWRFFSKSHRKSMGQETIASSTPQQVERRRHPRCRFSEPILIHRKDGSSCQATTSDISLCGLSAASTSVLRPGEEVRLSLAAGEEITAMVRRKIGTIYGLNSFPSRPKLRRRLKLCAENWLPFGGLQPKTLIRETSMATPAEESSILEVGT